MIKNKHMYKSMIITKKTALLRGMKGGMEREGERERWTEVWRTEVSSCREETGTGGSRRSVCCLQLFPSTRHTANKLSPTFTKLEKPKTKFDDFQLKILETLLHIKNFP